MSAAERVSDWERWLRYAREDLSAAELSLVEPGLTPRIGCFLTQPAAEKAIKAALVALGIAFPRRHDLDGLRNLLPEGWRIIEELPDLEPLTVWAVESRYPGDLPEATLEDARQTVVLARRVVDLMAEDLRANGFLNSSYE